MIDTLHRGGLTVVMITHESDVAARAQRRVRIIDGTIREEPTAVVGAATAPRASDAEA
jgi:putative ABC transport system ATP-binding protein